MASAVLVEPDAKKQKVSGGDDQMEVDERPGPRSEARVHDLMPAYYNRLFPHQLFYKWLVYGNDGKHPQADASFFQRREICFTLDGDVFVRYQSYKDGAELADDLIRKCPAKIDIGPLYTHNPRDRHKYGAAFQPVERELVFDIDLTDYDDVRTCGKEGHICTRCWPLMAVAIQILDRGLREDFGFNNILFVYSGRRGVHCWVCDPSARKLTDEQRSAIASYFSVYKGTEQDKVKVTLGATGDGCVCHPAIQAAYEVLELVWPELLTSQQLMEDQKTRDNMLKFIPDEQLARDIKQGWDKPIKASQDINIARWEVLKQKVDDGKAARTKLGRQLQKVEYELVFAHAYPRLDVEVSRKMNHLLKAPFCVHPKTGKVCVPIDPAAAHDFDPDAVPTVQSLLAELPPKAQGKATEEWSSTSLAPCIQFFQTRFLEGCLKSNREQLAALARAHAATPSLAF